MRFPDFATMNEDNVKAYLSDYRTSTAALKKIEAEVMRQAIRFGADNHVPFEYSTRYDDLVMTVLDETTDEALNTAMNFHICYCIVRGYRHNNTGGW